jgi:hypothetical protein
VGFYFGEERSKRAFSTGEKPRKHDIELNVRITHGCEWLHCGFSSCSSETASKKYNGVVSF